MANKTYEIQGEVETAQFAKITILDGAAAGSYQVNLDASIKDGLLSLGTIFVDGRERNVKINVEADLPELFATMAARKEAFVAKLQASREADVARHNFDAKMRQAGFEAAGNGAGLWNQLNPVNGNNF